MITDDVLLIQCIKENSDEKAFETLFEKYYSGLLRYARTLMPYPSDEAEDLVTGVFFSLWQQRAALHIHSSVASYLYIAVRNRIHDHYRKNRLVLEPITEIDEDAGSDYSLPDQLLMDKELYLEMERLVAMLPERTQLIFRMSREDQMTYADIATVLHISINSVKTQMYRAIKALKEAFRASNSDGNYSSSK